MGPSILIVEDEVDLANIMADYIRAAGYRATVVFDGAQALALIRRSVADRTPPDLITLDRMLPGLDGIALCRAVREFSEVPIIMVTARVEEIDRLLGLEVGADDYMCKPFSPRELVARIGVILRRARRGPSGTPPHQSSGSAPVQTKPRQTRSCGLCGPCGFAQPGAAVFCGLSTG